MNDTNNISRKSERMAVGLYGAGGFAKEVMPLIIEHIEKAKINNSNIDFDVFFVEKTPSETTLNGYKVISEDDFFCGEYDERLFNIAIGNSKLREKIASECIARGAKPLSVRSLHSVTYDCNDIGHGEILCAHTTVTSNVKIGNFFHANLYSYIAHDCIIGDFVTFGPNVHCNGNVTIHDHAYIGTGAIIRDGTPANPIVIGEGAVVGMGAVVTKSVAPFTTVIGSPARPLVKA